MKYNMFAVVMAAASMNAYALSGRVLDAQGSPVPNAVIEVVGSQTKVKTNNDGEFVFDDVSPHEIHITAPGFSHKVLHLDDVDETQRLDITLTNSVIEQVDVIGIPLHASVIESAQPVSVLSGEELRNRQAATLGDSLANEVGVHSNFHGNVASTPIIRGLSGPRVLITQNSLDVSDVSRVGPDHAVASEVSTAEQLEVLRGPATLFYGSGAIGGVVNVVDKRVPTDTQTTGEWLLTHETVNSQDLVSANLNSGLGNVGFHLDGFWRESDDYEVPVSPEVDHEDDGAEEDHEHENIVGNTGEESQGYTFGTSYLLDNGYVGVSVGRLEREYGIPGHSHGGHEHEADEESVYADLEQDRYQLISELDFDHPLVKAINTRAGYSDYLHAEIENGEVGTTFSNTTSELRVDVLHQHFAEWQGGLVFHYKNSEISAEGEEAFTPPSESETLALALVEERHFGNVMLQLGARAEHVTLNADNVLLPNLDVHDHDEEDEHNHEEDAALTRVFSVDQEFTPLSFSAGAVWDFHPGYNLGISLTHAERAPSASELFSFGPHIGTRSYEVGAMFTVEDDGEAHFELNRQPVELETSNNIDITLRKHEGDFGFILNAFYNQVDNYYYQYTTGLFAESGHSHDHDHEGDDEEGGEEDIHADELPVYVFTSADAELYGFEAQGIWQLTPNIKTTLFSDYVRAKLVDGGNLPRTPPLRFGARVDYQWQQLSGNVSWSHFSEQDELAGLETPTSSYDWLDATISYAMPSSPISLFVKAENITDTEARVHSSFLKDIAPKPGRNFRIGLRANF